MKIKYPLFVLFENTDKKMFVCGVKDDKTIYSSDMNDALTFPSYKEAQRYAKRHMRYFIAEVEDEDKKDEYYH